VERSDTQHLIIIGDGYRKISKGNKMKIAKMLLASLFITTLCSAFAGEKITLDIQGNQETVVKLEKLTSIKKDNFEKTTEFTKRLCEQTYKAFGITNKTAITFGLEYGKYATSAQYNADKQAFVFHVADGSLYYTPGKDDLFKWNPDFDPHKYQGIGIDHVYHEALGTYSGKNAFGVSKEIKVGAETAAVLYFSTKESKYLEIFLLSKPEEARRIEKDLRVAIITRIQPPCFVSGKGHKSPTINYAYDMSLSEVGIVGAPNPEWVIYLDSTKEILKRGKFH
jgi:hypothetical protein